jgi:hypothetical protein
MGPAAGPTYVKSFLRTYAEALGLDGKLLIEEYKLRHERLSDVEMQPIAPPGRATPAPPRGGVRAAWLWPFVVVVLIARAVRARRTDGDDGGSTRRTAVPTSTPARRRPRGPTPRRRQEEEGRPSRSSRG